MVRAENSALTIMFDKTSYTAGTGKSYPEYLMNRDGFSLLVMGFTGRKSLEWKIKYIQAFNAMEKELRNSGVPYVLIMKYHKKHPVLSSADVAALLHVTRETVTQTLQQPLAKCKHGRDYYLVQGDNLAAPENNKEISAWVKDIRGYMDVLDGLLHKYEQQNPVKTQEALKEVMRSLGKDIWEDVIRLTCQKYDLVTI